MTGESKPVHPSAGEVAEDGVEVVRDERTDERGVVVPGVSSEPSETIDGIRATRRAKNNNSGGGEGRP
jgi:hypothetical protein